MTMPRKWIAVLAAAVAAGGLALAATSVLGGSPQPRPDYAQVDAKLDNAKPSFARALARKGTKPKAIYLTGQGTVDTSPPPQGTGPYIDFTLSAKSCKRVVDGGIQTDNVDVYQQGTYIAGRGEYHVLMGLDDGAVATPVTFNYSSHLICLKGIK